MLSSPSPGASGGKGTRTGGTGSGGGRKVPKKETTDPAPPQQPEEPGPAKEDDPASLKGRPPKDVKKFMDQKLEELRTGDDSCPLFSKQHSLNQYRAVGRAVNAINAKLLAMGEDGSDPKMKEFEVMRDKLTTVFDVVGCLRRIGTSANWRVQFIHEWRRIDSRLKQQANVSLEDPQRGRFNYGFEDIWIPPCFLFVSLSSCAPQCYVGFLLNVIWGPSGSTSLLFGVHPQCYFGVLSGFLLNVIWGSWVPPCLVVQLRLFVIGSGDRA